MVSMKRASGEMEIASPSYYADCPSIYLSDDQVEALGLTGAQVGQKLSISGVAFVSSQRSELENPGEGSEGATDVYLTIHITDLEASTEGKADPGKAARALYGS